MITVFGNTECVCVCIYIYKHGITILLDPSMQFNQLNEIQHRITQHIFNKIFPNFSFFVLNLPTLEN